MLFSLFHFCQYTLNSSLSLNRHLCADDTLPFFSFLPTNFDSSITYYKMLFNRPSPGRLQIFQHLTPLKLNPCSSNSKSNYTKYITPRCTQPIPLASLTSSLMNTSPLQTKFHHSLNQVIIIFINSAVFALTSIPQQPPPLPPPILHRSLGT